MAEKNPDADRYKSFAGIDCDGDSRRLIGLIRRHIDDPDKTDDFWEAFKGKLAEVGGEAKPDGLRLVCSYVSYIEDLFERYADRDGIALLQQLEERCC